MAIGAGMSLGITLCAFLLCSFTGLKYIWPPPQENSFVIDFTEEIEDEELWAKSADTPINDPICIAADNDYYLYRNFRRQSEFAGCLFMDFRGSGDWTNRNNLVYGHTVAGSTTRFGTLRYYSSQVYYRNHPVMWLFTRDHVYKCYVFAVYKTRFTKDGVFKTFEGDPDGFTAWLKEAEAKSVIDSNISYRDVTKTLSLCTCCTGASQGYRWNVVLSLVQQDP